MVARAARRKLELVNEDSDLDMGADGVTQSLSAARIADGPEDPMGDPDDVEDMSDDAELLEDAYAAFSSDDEAIDDEDEELEDEDEEDEEEEEDEDNNTSSASPRKRIAISPSRIPVTDNAAAAAATPSSTLHPQRPIPYIPDAGHLLITDPNPLPSTTTEAALASNARDAAQALLNHLLTTCPITSLPTTSTSSSGVEMTLPAPQFQLPREKRVPVPKPPTKWETFAARKGIGKNKREGKTVYDEAKGEWVPKWGYKGKNKDGEGDWLVEVDEKAERKALQSKKGVQEGVAGVDPRSLKRAERKERMRRNDRAMRANERNSRKGTGA